jgi:3-hydroxyacyl-[acyl-carrier-protein] dehydratase
MMSEYLENLLIREVMEILPHRYPMLLVDRILVLEPLKRVVGYKNLSINEPFFQGHFPGNPLMPGVLIVEAMAQLGATIIMSPEEFRQQTAVLTGIEKARFRRPVVPGDRLDMEAQLVRMRSKMGWCSGTASVDGKLVFSAELMFSLATFSELSIDASVVYQ